MPGQKKKKKPRDLRLLKSVIQPKAEEVKKSVCSFSYFVTVIKTLCLILFYYFFSISLTFYNQHFIHEYQLPLSFTMSHLVLKFVAAGLIRWILECRSGELRVLLGWREYCKRVALTGIVSSLDIGLSNWSFDFITVSLYTMSKSSAVIFILGFALLFRLEKCRFSQVFVVIFIAVGLFMFTYQSTQFNLEGFVMVMTASLLSGLRWTLAQTVLQKNDIGLHNPLDMMYHIQPWMMLTLFPLAATAEGMQLASTEVVFRFSDIEVLAKNMGLVMAGATLAFFLEFSEFLLVCNTSSLTLSIAGIFKELCVLYLAVYVNGDQVNFVNGIGLVICLAGIALHIILKAVFARYDREQEMVRSINRPEEKVEMLTRNGDPNSNNPDDEDDEEDIFNVDRDRTSRDENEREEKRPNMTSSQKRILLWAVPRSVSSAMCRVMMNSGLKTQILFEPYSYSYYFGPERFSNRYPDISPDPKYSYENAKNEFELPYSDSVRALQLYLLLWTRKVQQPLS